MRVSAMTFSALIPHPSLALGMSFPVVLISQDGDEYNSMLNVVNPSTTSSFQLDFFACQRNAVKY